MCFYLSYSTRAQKKGYEEVHVPAVKHIPVEGEVLVPIDDLPEWCKPAFKVCGHDPVVIVLSPILQLAAGTRASY